MARGLLIASAIFFAALMLRVANGGRDIAPADELYHWKRMTFSAQHFPQVLEFDDDRGIGGAFCPWPPLYDFVSGVLARTLGARNAGDVLARVIWIPPIAGSFGVALAVMFIARRFGLLAAISAAIALAASPFVVTQSSLGSIDHHFLEWMLVFAIAAAATRGGWRLALAMSAALFVQTALMLACAVAFAVALFNDDCRKAAGAFFASSAAVTLYRLTRATGYPNSAWFLGWPHAVLLAAAGVALVFRRRWIGIICGIAIGLVALPQLIEATHFFGGDRWFSTIVEFQPMWRSHGADLMSQIAGLSVGPLLVWFLLPRTGRESEVGVRSAIALSAVVFLILTILNRRFWSVSIPMLAIGGAIAAASFKRKEMRFLATAAVAVIPAIQLGMWMRHPTTHVQRYQVAWIRAADFLRSQPGGRVLAPWAMGHLFDAIGQHAVLIDNFGSMPDAALFEEAHRAMLAPDESSLARYCDAWKIRYVALYDPTFGLRTASTIAAIPVPPVSWWRSAYDQDVSTARFRLIYRSDPDFARAVVKIWEYSR